MEPVAIVILIFLVFMAVGSVCYCIAHVCKESGTVGMSSYNHARITGMPNFRRTGYVGSGWRSTNVYNDTTTNYNDLNEAILNVKIDGDDCCNRNDNCKRNDDCCFGGDDYLSNDAGEAGCDKGGNDDFGGDDYLSNDAAGDTGGCDSGGGDTGGCDSGGGDTGGCDSGGGDTGGCDSGGGGGGCDE